MAKPNYQYEKRQRELAKKAKQEEKRRQKLIDAPKGDGPQAAVATATGTAPADGPRQ